MTSEVICYSSRYTADLGQLKFDVDQNSKFISSISNKCPYYILICSPNYPVGRIYIVVISRRLPSVHHLNKAVRTGVRLNDAPYHSTVASLYWDQ